MKPASQWQRVAIIGPSGAGKSTLARQLGPMLNLPIIHFDTEYWQPGWKEPDKLWWRARARELAQRDRWIIDGNFGDTMQDRLDAADAIVLFDFSTLRCLWGVIKRVLKYRGLTRPDLAHGCPEKWDWEFIQYVLMYRREYLPETLARLARVDRGKRVVVVRNHDDTEKFVRELVEELVCELREEISAHRC